MSPEALARVQDAFRGAVLSGDDGGLPAWLDAGSTARIAVYRNTVQASLVEVIAAAFPVVNRIVGAGFFGSLARRFVTAAPPRRPQLSVYGAEFAAFIDRDAAAQTLPYLGDVARLEWARGEAYFAADAPSLDPERLGRRAPETLTETVLALHPATRLVASRFPIHRIWQVNQPEVAEIPAMDMSRAETVLIARAGLRVTVRPIAAADAAMIGAIAAGHALGEAMAAAQAADAGFDLEAALRDHFIGGTFADPA